MDPLIGIALFLLVVPAIFTFMSIKDRRNKERIEKEIRQVGGEPVEISVQFTDVLGRKHETRCKVDIYHSNLFWQRTPAELLSDLPVEDESWSRHRAAPGSSKEQLIDDLVAENEKLREQLMHV